MGKRIENVIYILTNPQYPGYVKIGYASDLKSRISSLNTGALVEFSPYAVYETSLQNADVEIHEIIGLLNPILRSSKFENGKAKGKEFFKLEPEEAFELLRHIAKVSGTESKAYRVTSNYQPMSEDDVVLQSNQDESLNKSYSRQVLLVKQLEQCSGPDVMLDCNEKPKVVRYVRDESESAVEPFTTWVKFLIDTCKRAIDAYGKNWFESIVLAKNDVLFHTKTVTTFAKEKEELGGRRCVQLYDDDTSDNLWLMTDYDAWGVCRIVSYLVKCFPLVEMEFVYD